MSLLISGFAALGTMLLFGMTIALPFVAVGLERYRSRMLNMKDSGNYYAVA
jgi:hypothetical protein